MSNGVGQGIVLHPVSFTLYIGQLHSAKLLTITDMPLFDKYSVDLSCTDNMTLLYHI